MPYERFGTMLLTLGELANHVAIALDRIIRSGADRRNAPEGIDDNDSIGGMIEWLKENKTTHDIPTLIAAREVLGKMGMTQLDTVPQVHDALSSILSILKIILEENLDFVRVNCPDLLQTMETFFSKFSEALNANEPAPNHF